MLLYKQIKKINKEVIKKTLSRLLKEDTPKGDLTTLLVVAKKEKGKYVIRAREEIVFCGATIITNAFSSNENADSLLILLLELAMPYGNVSCAVPSVIGVIFMI